MTLGPAGPAGLSDPNGSPLLLTRSARTHVRTPSEANTDGRYPPHVPGDARLRHWSGSGRETRHRVSTLPST